jgi:uncharacterized membrane protein YhaH (DUF805 family)
MSASSRREETPYSRPPARQSVESENQGTYYGELSFFDSSGRLGRVRFMAWNLALGLSFFPAAIFPVLAIPLGIVTFWLGIVFLVQRLHDMDMSGAWIPCFIVVVLAILAWLVASPSLGRLVVFFLVVWLIQGFVCTRPGDATENRYGLPPPPNNRGLNVLAGMYLVFLAFAFISSANEMKVMGPYASLRGAVEKGNMEKAAQILEQQARNPKFQREMQQRMQKDLQLRLQMRRLKRWVEMQKQKKEREKAGRGG